jgi:hypothetical protein
LPAKLVQVVASGTDAVDEVPVQPDTTKTVVSTTPNNKI